VEILIGWKKGNPTGKHNYKTVNNSPS
jgi:hypothetical protein